MLEDLQKQIFAIQLIQELIVDKLDEAGVFSRKEFENELKEKVDEFNKTLEKISKELNDDKTKTPAMFMSNIVGEA
jgi:division protein CdvB (Snf7/Vps24/ESCRT-III family)